MAKTGKIVRENLKPTMEIPRPWGSGFSPPQFTGKGVRPIDPGIRRAVKILWENGIETTESCEGGPGHSFPQPTVRFCGQNDQGYRAVAIALAHGLRVDELRRCWSVINGELVGPQWEITFVRSEPTSPRR